MKFTGLWVVLLLVLSISMMWAADGTPQGCSRETESCLPGTPAQQAKAYHQGKRLELQPEKMSQLDQKYRLWTKAAQVQHARGQRAGCAKDAVNDKCQQLGAPSACCGHDGMNDKGHMIDKAREKGQQSGAYHNCPYEKNMPTK